MNSKEFHIEFEKRLVEVERMMNSTNKSSVLFILQVPNNNSNDLLLPYTRESISNIICFVEISDESEISYILEKSKGLIDRVVIDIDKKRENSDKIIENIKENLDILYYTYSDLKMWAEAATNFLSQTTNNINEQNVKEIQNKAHVNLSAKLSEVAKLVHDGKISSKEADAQLNHVENFFVKSAEDLKRVIDLDDAFYQKETDWVKSSVSMMKAYLNTEEDEQKVVDGRVFVRDYAGPIHSLADCAALHPEVKTLMEAYTQATSHMGFGAYSLETLMQYYIDGKNTVSEIAHKVQCDTLTECLEITQKFLELLEGMKLVHQK